MPIVVDQLMSSGARVWVWHVTETERELKKFLPEAIFDRILSDFRLPLRQKQKMVSQILLQGLGDGHSPEWYYSEAGKPLFRAYPGHFSISHSRDFVGLVYHPLDKCGIDLEELREKILVIAPRFTHDTEAAWVRKANELEDLTLIWSVKEALFKTIGGGGIHFKTQLRVWAPLRQSNRYGHGTAVFDGAEGKINFSYYYIYLEGVLLVHTIAMESPA